VPESAGAPHTSARRGSDRPASPSRLARYRRARQRPGHRAEGLRSGLGPGGSRDAQRARDRRYDDHLLGVPPAPRSPPGSALAGLGGAVWPRISIRLAGSSTLTFLLSRGSERSVLAFFGEPDTMRIRSDRSASESNPIIISFDNTSPTSQIRIDRFGPGRDEQLIGMVVSSETGQGVARRTDPREPRNSSGDASGPSREDA